MSKSKYVKCRYSHCKHEQRELLKEDAERSGNCYYHKDCYEEVKAIAECIDLYDKHFDTDPIWAQVRRTMNEILYKRGYDPLYLLFAMKYAVAHNQKINHPAGLFYLVKDQKIKQAWEVEKQRKHVKNVVVDNKETDFEYVQEKKKGFADIIGG